ncbi:unnamed protein product [Chilo suppressalis]|uniref:CRAL-TRIO domain-containing protein n=1 Tax=Chilo suppressalis TaxID=168631 RepID=A0ABN8L0P7_CHISP|nr:hypothetical protein evm_009363 [Chilo suppressalis]CAH2979730.1 unnamed protein product [Chilo suppressalis]
MSVVEFSYQKEYDKNPELKVEDVMMIRIWLKEQPHLPHSFITDLDIILALHCCGFDIEMTKRVIDLNYTLRTLFTFYSYRQPDKSLETAYTWLVTPLITPTLKGYRAVYCHLLDSDTKKFVYSDVVRSFMMVMDLWQYEEGTWPGVVIVVNMANVTIGHVSGIDLNVAQQFFYFLQKAMFIRLKEFHFINAPGFVDKMLSMLKPFLTLEMLEMLKVHQVGSDSLDRYIPRAALPKEAGGLNKDCTTLRDEIWEKIKSNSHFFDEEAKKRVDESKRPGTPITISSIFPSMESSFKNLCID